MLFIGLSALGKYITEGFLYGIIEAEGIGFSST